MSKPQFDGAAGAGPVRQPVVVNQLGPDVARAVAGHWSRPRVIEHPAETPSWHLPPEADVLLTRPFAGWLGAPAERPPGWPFGLRWIQTASTGVDFFPSWLLDDVVVTIGRGASAVAIAEYVLAAILGFEKRLHEVRPEGPEQWGKGTFGSVAGKVVGLAGFGSIGRAVAERARAFGLTVQVLKRSPWSEPLDGIVPVPDIATLVAAADHLVLALPATPQTVGLVDADVLSRARPSLHLINVARGRIVDQAALLRALDGGRLAAATLDVTDPEPLPPGHALYSHPKVVLTPHISWTGGDHAQRLIAKTLANLDAYARGAALADVFDKDQGY